MEEVCKKANIAIKQKDYLQLQSLLSLYTPSAMQSHTLSAIVEAIEVIEEGEWREVFLGHLRAIKALCQGDLEAVFNAQLDAAQAFLRIFGLGDRGLLGVLNLICRDLWTAAITEKRDAIEEEAARTINRAFTLCITDRAALSTSRKWGTFMVLSLLLKVYFHRKQLNLCVQLLRAVKTAELPDMHKFPCAHVAPFYYYSGRFLLASIGDLSIGLEYLRGSLKICLSASKDDVHAKRNCFRIMHYYIPCHLLAYSHHIPAIKSVQLISLYRSLLNSLVAGNVPQYRELVRGNIKKLAKIGVLVAFERLETAVLRNLIKHISRLSSTRIPLAVLLAMAGGQSVYTGGVIELGCILAALISKGGIRGYLSEKPAYLVLSSKDPFPPYSLV